MEDGASDSVGARVGETLGLADGSLEIVGWYVGPWEGLLLGWRLGVEDGALLGESDEEG